MDNSEFQPRAAPGSRPAATKAAGRRRRYQSAKRRAQAESTRHAIIKAAGELFSARGYAATSLKEVAEKAGVSLPTVYGVFSSKRNLLLEVFQAGRTRTVDHESTLTAAIREADAGRLTARAVARAVRTTREGGAPVAGIIQGAADADHELAALWQELQEDRHRRTVELVETLVRLGKLRSGVSVESAVDEVWALTSNEVYLLLVSNRGWSPARYEDWLARMLATTILAD